MKPLKPLLFGQTQHLQTMRGPLGFLNKTKRFIKNVGPGLITGAADDDPSGIATYIMAGARFGTTFLWSALFTWPLMAVVQMACAQIGIDSRTGLANAFKQKLPMAFLIPVCIALFVANSLNIAADLAAMAEGLQLILPFNYHLLILFFALLITALTIFLEYRQITYILKWLSLFLGSYILVVFTLKPDWRMVFKELFTPKIPRTPDEWQMLVAILGTTISPYLFFWQTSQEVEEQLATKLSKPLNKTAKKEQLLFRNLDVALGTFVSNLVMMFVILSSALTLHKIGLTQVTSSKEAALALVPIAGNYAALIFTLGVIGVGLLAIPTLTCSAAYALAETLNWKKGLSLKFTQAKAFYVAIIASTLIAVMIDFTNITPLKALYGAAIINGLLAPFLLILLLWLLMDAKKFTPRWMKIILFITMLVMSIAGIGMFL